MVRDKVVKAMEDTGSLVHRIVTRLAVIHVNLECVAVASAWFARTLVKLILKVLSELAERRTLNRCHLVLVLSHVEVVVCV